MSIFDLPQEAPRMPPVTNFGYQRVNALSDIRDVVGQTHKFRIEPSGTQHWCADRSYFRARMQLTVTANKARLAKFGLDKNGTGSGAAIPNPFPLKVTTIPGRCRLTQLTHTVSGSADKKKYVNLPVGLENELKDWSGNAVSDDLQKEYDVLTPGLELRKSVGGVAAFTDARTSPYTTPLYNYGSSPASGPVVQTISSAFPVQGQAGSSRLSYSQRTVVDSIDDFNGSYDSSVGLSQILPNTSPTGGVSTELISVANDPWSDATKYKFLEALKFVELADNCVDAFFDQISFSVGTTKVETIQDPQLTQTMRQRVKSGALSNAYRQDQLGGYKDEQSHNNLSGNLGDKSDQSLFSLLGYENIHIEGAATDVNYPQEFTKRTFTVEFDILYRPALAIFRYSHALPAARYEVEFKGVASQSQFQNNFFHCTRPGGLGRWAMTHSADRAGNLVNGPAQKYDGRVMQEYRTIGTHASHQLFFFEPISGHGPNHHKDVMDSYLFGRQGYSSVDLTHQRLDPGVWVSANLIDMWLEMAVIEGPETTQTDFVLAFDHLQPVYQTLTFGSDQTLTYDVDARANTFFFGFRSTTVDNDCCLQAGHLLTKGNTERDLDQYHINFDLKTRPQNYATHINLRSVRGATNEQLRSQINTMVHFKGYPETPRSWMKKGPYFAYYWPRSANANATRFTLNLRLRNNKQDREFGTYGPYGQFEYETPIVTANYNLPRVDPRKSPTEIEVSRTSGVVGYVGQYRNNRINTTATEYAGFYLRPTVYSAPANQDGLANGFYDFKEEPTGYVPYWSVEVPQSLRLQKTQTRLLGMDYPSATSRASAFTVGHIPGNQAANEDGNPDVSGPTRVQKWAYAQFGAMGDALAAVDRRSSSLLQTAFRRTNHSYADSGFRGTQHSAPENCQLNNPENSCILFQVIPQAFFINIVHGRVTAVQTPMNNN